jgi:hypothetical protein
VWLAVMAEVRGDLQEQGLQNPEEVKRMTTSHFSSKL